MISRFSGCSDSAIRLPYASACTTNKQIDACACDKSCLDRRAGVGHSQLKAIVYRLSIGSLG